MSRRKRTTVERKRSERTADKKNGISAASENIDSRNRWRRLSFQTKLLTITSIGLLTLGAFGAGWKYLDENAKQTMAQREAATLLSPAQESLLAKINPLVAAATPTPAPQLSKEYIYAGSRLLAVEDANASAAPPADLAVWRPSSGAWWVMGGNGSQQVTQAWGMAGDKPVPGDYDGDGKTDFSIFRPDSNAHTGTWFILFSSSGSYASYQFGLDTDTPASADYDGDGRTDTAIWRAANGGWYILKSSDNQILSYSYGAPGDKPAPADYDGDGKADPAVWRSSNATFYSQNSSNNLSQIAAFSTSSAEPVSADYDGDGRADFAIRSGAYWIIKNSSNGALQSPVVWQNAGDIAVHNDYDGDGKCDVAVWRASNGNWYILKSSTSQLRQEQWGTSGDIPVPAFYRR